MWSKLGFFVSFSKTALTILANMLLNVELISIEQPATTACPNFAPFSSYSSTKCQFWAKTGKVVSVGPSQRLLVFLLVFYKIECVVETFIMRTTSIRLEKIDC